MALNITRGREAKGIKVILYGCEGIGKTTLASHFPGAVFLDTEGSTKHFDVARLPRPTSWEMLKAEVQEVTNHAAEVGTLVIDTADWAERLCNQVVYEKAGKSGIEDFGYGKGYVFAAEEFGRLLDLLSQLAELGVHVVFTAHAQQRKVELPDQMDSYDKYELKCSKQVSPMLKEWADMVLFCNFKTFVVQSESGKGKAQGGERRMYAAHRPAFDAKNRFGLPDDMPMDFGQIAHLFPTPTTGHPVQNVTAPASSPAHAGAPTMTESQTTPNTMPPTTIDSAPEVVSAAQEPEVQAKEPDIDPFTGRDLYEGIYSPLADLLRTKNVSPVDIQDIVHGAGILPTGPNGAYIEVRDYPEGLCQEIVSKWDSFWKLSEQYCNVPF